jgi:mono/diheme cytochrome c family protein
MRQRSRVWTGVVCTGALLFAAPLLHSQAARTVQDSVYTDGQAGRGQALYGKQCASCHGDKLQGAQAPPLAGDVFLRAWQARPLAELAVKIRSTMPLDAPGQLTPAQASDIVAHMLKAGGFPAGAAELPAADAALSRIALPARAAAQAAAAPGGGKVYPPIGNMAQLMRGIYFPNSNLIFTVQTHDPAAKPSPAPATGGSKPGGFSWVDWGAGIYGGWELVDNAAIALADAAPLMLAPGIRCENGRDAPVGDPDWIKYTEEMIEVARRTLKASQARNRDLVSELTGDLSDSCANCHRAYRDIRPARGGGALDPTDPSNKANRCASRVAK